MEGKFVLKAPYSASGDQPEAIRALAGSALIKLRDYYDACERVIARHEARGQWDDFRLNTGCFPGRRWSFLPLPGDSRIPPARLSRRAG